MSVISHDRGLPGCFGFAPAGFSFFEQAVIEIPAPIKYQIAQEFLQYIQRDFGPDFRYNVSKRAHEVWIAKRPWYCTMV